MRAEMRGPYRAKSGLGFLGRGSQPPPPPARGSGERRKLPQLMGPGRSPGHQTVLLHFKYSGWPLLTLFYVFWRRRGRGRGGRPRKPALNVAAAPVSIHLNINLTSLYQSDTDSAWTLFNCYLFSLADLRSQNHLMLFQRWRHSRRLLRTSALMNVRHCQRTHATYISVKTDNRCSEVLCKKTALQGCIGLWKTCCFPYGINFLALTILCV